MLAPLIRFATYREIAASVAARAAELAPRGGFAWPQSVIVPSRGVADAIAAELLLHLPQGVAGLQMPTIETLARDIVNDAGEYPRIASDAERRLAMRVAARSVDEPMMESRGIASMLERAWRDVRDGGLTLEELRARVGRASRGLRNAARTRAILRAWGEYEKLIAQLGAVDPAEVLLRAAAIVGAPHPPPHTYILAGFYDMTGVQLALVSALDRAGLLEAVYIPVGGGEAYRFAKPFVSRFTTIGRAEQPPSMLHVKQPRVSVTELETRHVELEEACREVAALLAGGVKPSDIAIVARAVDPYDARLVQRFAAAHGFTTTLEDEKPLTAQRIGRGVASLLRLRERGFPRAEVLELVRDGFRARVRIDADTADAKTREARIAGGTSDELRHLRGKAHPAVGDYLALLAEIEQVTKRLDAQLRGGEWSDLLTQLLSRFRLETDEDLQAADRIEEVARLFARFPLRFDVSAVVDALEQGAVKPPRTMGRQPVFFGDVMRFRGRSFAHLFAVRMQDEVFPQRRTEDPLFPDADRRLLGLREIGNGRDEEQLLFQLLFDGASTSLRFSFAGTDGFGKPLRKSTLLRGLAAERKSPPIATRRIEARRPLQLLARSGTKSVFDGYVSPIPPELIATVTPSRLEDFGECPQKFLLKWILGVRDLDDPERELQINHRDKGSVDHRILENLYRSLDETDVEAAAAELPRLPQSIAKRLEQAVDREFDRLEEEAPPFNRTVRGIERRATKRVLRDFVASDLADLATNGLVPRWFEYRFGKPRRDGSPADHAEPFIIDAAGVPIRVDGQIDRIDVGQDAFRIVDYKSGKALRHQKLGEKIDRGVRLQLALYAMAVAEFFEADPSRIRGTIKPLVLEGKPATFAFDLAEKHGGLRETLGIFVKAILAGRFPAFPNEKDDDFNSCKYCPVNHSCRTKHDGEEKQEVTRAGEPRTLLMGEAP